MPDLNELRGLGQQVRPPSFDSLVTTARRRTRRAATAAVGACAAAVILIGGGVLTAADDDRSAPAPATPPSEPTYSPRAGEVVELPQGRNGLARLREGRYAVQLTPATSAELDGPNRWYEIDVPDMWQVLSGRFLNNAPTQDAQIFFVAHAPADATQLPTHPCRPDTTRTVGPTVSDLADAIQAQPLLDVTEPVPVTLDGHRGLYLEVTIPDQFNTAPACSGQDTAALFSAGRDGWQWEAGYIGRWWILDVDGERMVVMPQCDTSCSKDDLDTLTTMAESITFTTS